MKQKHSTVKRFILPIVLVLIVAVVTLTATGVFASLGDTTSVINVKTGQVGCEVTKNYSIRSTGTVPCLIRAKVVVNWLDEEGNLLAFAPEDAQLSIIPASGWVQRPDKDAEGKKPPVEDGYWYYAGVAQPGEQYAFLDTVKATGGKVRVTVLAEALQAAPKQAVLDAWGMEFRDGAWKAK